MQSVCFEKFILLYGGYVKKVDGYLTDCFVFKPNEHKFEVFSTKENPSPRIDFSMSTIGENGCLLFGGSNGYMTLDDSYILSLENKEWQKLDTSVSPEPRLGHSTIYFKQRVYLFGGWTGEKTLNDVWEFNTVNYKWSKLVQKNKIQSRYRHSCTRYSNYMIVFGGVDHHQNRFSDLHIFNLINLVWKSVKIDGVQPSKRTFHKSAMKGEFMYIFGGFDGSKLNDVWRINCNELCYNTWNRRKVNSAVEMSKPLYLIPDQLINIQDNKWTKLYPKFQLNILSSPCNPPSQRTGHFMLYYNNSLYVIGGIDSNDCYIALDFIDVYKIDERKWYKRGLSGDVPSLRSGMRAIRFNGEDEYEFLVIGGYHIDRYFNEAYTIDLNSFTWNRCFYVEDTNFEGRSDFSICRVDQNFYLYGGRNTSTIFDDVEMLGAIGIDSNCFRVSKVRCPGGKPKSRFGHIAVKSGTSMFVIGGWDGSNCLNEVHEFSTESRIWFEVLLMIGQRLSKRYRLEACIDEEENSVFIFGGVNSSRGRFNDLFEYKIDKKEWRKIEVKGDIPTGRSFHRMVLVSKILFVFGGFDGQRRNDLYAINIRDSNLDGDDDDELSVHKESLVEQIQAPGYPEFKKDQVSYYKLLNHRIFELKRRLVQEQREKLCKVCWCHEINTIFLTCKHSVSCYNCSRNLSRCSFCNKPITRVIRTYSS